MKIVVVGPAASGKSTISNFLCGSKDSLQNDKYSPTVGVRILETELKDAGQTVAVEIWDSSGDTA